jgi:hypothetical protein
MEIAMMDVSKIKNRNLISHIVIFLTVLIIIAQNTDSYSQKKPAKEGSPDKGIQQDGIANLHKRLADTIGSLHVKPDTEGKHTFVISSGSFYDAGERSLVIYDKKALVFMQQGKISKIIFEYYQYSFGNMIREVKTLTNTNPNSDDIASLEIRYDNNAGETQSYRVGDLNSSQSRKDVIEQYSSYLLSLINRLELGRNKNKFMESTKIERTIQLGK